MVFSKAHAYILQENGYDTGDANLKLEFVDDSREHSDAIRVLKILRSLDDIDELDALPQRSEIELLSSAAEDDIPRTRGSSRQYISTPHQLN